jgi:TIR domain
MEAGASFMAHGYVHDIFISYRHMGPAHTWVTEYFFPLLKKWLPDYIPSNYNFDEEKSIFIDQQIETGSSWPIRLNEALHTSRCLLPIWSPQYFRSDWCKAELHTMLEREKMLGLRKDHIYNEWIHRDVPIREILNFMRIPYISFWSFGEKIPVIKPGTEDPEDIGFSLETLAALVAQKFSATDELVRNRDTFVEVARRGAYLSTIGSTSPSQTTRSNPPITIFISYSHYDAYLENQLEKHLAILKRQQVIKIWADKEIASGAAWSEEINTRLETADIIVLLISPDYLASPASDREMERALARHQEGKAIVMPVILRPVDWQASPIAAIQVLPPNGIPVSAWSSKDMVWAEVATGIRTAVQSLQNSQKH